jgi:Zn-dependent peptidase ImmA (M78 family)
MRRFKKVQASIEQRAAQVLQEAGVLKAPVDLERVAEYLKVGVHVEPLEHKVSGVLMVKSGERHALVNATHPASRQRFSLAHELGHLVLHDSAKDRLFVDTSMRMYQRVGAAGNENYASPDSTTTPHEEREANRFASALLMPAGLVAEESADLDLAEETAVATLARRFAVSEQAMSIRLQQLNVLSPLDIDDL